MGYAHYYNACGWNTAEWQAAWPKLIRDVPLILEASDVLICGPYDKYEDLVPPIVDVDEGICFNGVADDGFETFYLSQEVSHHFVKTLQKPSDGNWDQLERVRPRRLYQKLWPGESIQCPWSEVDAYEESTHDRADGQNLAMGPSKTDGPPAVVIPNTTSGITETSKRFQLDSSSFSQLETTKSTVLGVDFSHIGQWLSRCEEDISHTECKASPIQWLNLPGTQFKVIDVHRRCVVKAPERCSFIILTYVWGGVDQPRLNKTTAQLLMRDEGLDVAWPNIPTTIRDAIIVCEQLEERYLWMDALCIMEDSVQDMKFHILRMKQIYSAVKCTIAAVSAETVGIGLLKSSPANHSRPTRLCKSEGSLKTLLESSPWSTRAWCYREKVLSRRLILFTSNGIYLQCQKGTYDAKGALLPGKDSDSVYKFNAAGGMLSISPGEDLESYVSAVEHYSQRKLTKQEDKISAFQGIFQIYSGRIDGKKSSFYYGLPICAFDQTVCWRTRRHNPHLRNQLFPSWSWLGWNDEVSFDRKMFQTVRTNQMVYGLINYHEDIEDTSELRKPASQYMLNSKFGFPAAASSCFYNSPEQWIDGSVAELCIALDPLKSDGSNSLYAVFPNSCGRQPAPSPSRMISLTDFLQQPAPSSSPMITLMELVKQPMSKFDWMDTETATAPSVPAAKQTDEEYNLIEHDQHEGCELQTPLGYIWLDRKWREK